MELAAAGEDMKKLREIARVHIARCEAGDMQAIKELANRLDGRPAQILEHNGPDSQPPASPVAARAASATSRHMQCSKQPHQFGSLLALHEAPNCEQPSNNKAYPRNRHGYGEWANLHHPSINYSHDVGQCHDSKDQCRNSCVGRHFILSHYVASPSRRSAAPPSSVMNSRRFTVPVLPGAPDRKDSTPQRDCCAAGLRSVHATFGSGSREPPNPNGLLVTPDWHVAE